MYRFFYTIMAIFKFECNKTRFYHYLNQCFQTIENKIKIGLTVSVSFSAPTRTSYMIFHGIQHFIIKSMKTNIYSNLVKTFDLKEVKWWILIEIFDMKKSPFLRLLCTHNFTCDYLFFVIISLRDSTRPPTSWAICSCSWQDIPSFLASVSRCLYQSSILSDKLSSWVPG